MKFRVWDEKYREWDTHPFLLYPGEEIRKQGRIIQFSSGIKFESQDIYDGDTVLFSLREDGNDGIYGEVILSNGQFSVKTSAGNMFPLNSIKILQVIVYQNK